MSDFKKIFENKKHVLEIYTPLRFIKEIDKTSLIRDTIIKPLKGDIDKKLINVVNINIDKKNHYFLVRPLIWDTNYFGFPIYKIELILYEHNNCFLLHDAINKFIKNYCMEKKCNYIIDIPSEDILLIQALSNTKFSLIETRLNFHISDIDKFEYKRFSVRDAQLEDIEVLKKVAMKMRNKYDRVHADPVYTTKQADEYLGSFTEESIKGFADIIIVPSISSQEPNGFLAANKPINILGLRISKLVLAAVDNTFEKGWLFKLLTEMIYRMKELNANYITTNTQASNYPAIKTWEKAGFKLNYVTHIFSFNNQ